MLRKSGLLAIALVTFGCAETASVRGPIDLSQISPDKKERLAKFEAYNPEQAPSIQYTGLDYFLNAVVLDVGLSDRKRDFDVGLATGTRVRRGSSSDVILEANRIDFETMARDDRYIEFIASTRSSLETLPNSRPLSTFNRNDQLAYWINLHNAIVLDELLERYPFRRPSLLKVNQNGEQVSLFDAKLTTIEGVPLSLNDIRVHIVYRQWRDKPEVIYGFFTGDISSPSLIPRAYNGATVSDYLERNARDYVNSLRGVETFYNVLRVSPLYNEVRSIYFPNWREDLKTHLSKYAKSKLRSDINAATSISFTRYNADIAALPPDDRISSSPGAPIVQAVGRDATSLAGGGGPSTGAAPALDSNSGLTDFSSSFDTLVNNSNEVIAPSGNERTLRKDFLDRIQRKRRLAASGDFWPSLRRPETNVTLEDVVTVDPDRRRPENNE